MGHWALGMGQREWRQFQGTEIWIKREWGDGEAGEMGRQGSRGAGEMSFSPLPLEPLLPHAQCSMPNAQCPMPNAQCPMLHAQCPMPNAPCPIRLNLCL